MKWILAKLQKLWQWPTPTWQNRWFLRDRTLVVLLSKHKCGHLARIGSHCRSCLAEQARYAYWLGPSSRTFLNDFFLLQAVTFTPTSMRSLLHSLPIHMTCIGAQRSSQTQINRHMTPCHVCWALITRLEYSCFHCCLIICSDLKL